MYNLFVDKAFPIDAMEYVYDLPHDNKGVGESEVNSTDGLHAALAAAEHSVVIQSPYLVLSKRSRKLFTTLGKDHPILSLFSQPIAWPQRTHFRPTHLPTNIRNITSRLSVLMFMNSAPMRLMPRNLSQECRC